MPTILDDVREFLAQRRIALAAQGMGHLVRHGLVDYVSGGGEHDRLFGNSVSLSNV